MRCSALNKRASARYPGKGYSAGRRYQCESPSVGDCPARSTIFVRRGQLFYVLRSSPTPCAIRSRPAQFPCAVGESFRPRAILPRRGRFSPLVKHFPGAWENRSAHGKTFWTGGCCPNVHARGRDNVLVRLNAGSGADKAAVRTRHEKILRRRLSRKHRQSMVLLSRWRNLATDVANRRGGTFRGHAPIAAARKWELS
jgi:hypothetical protein